MPTLKVVGFLSVCFLSAVVCSDENFDGSLGSLGLKGSALVFCRSECRNKLGYVSNDQKSTSDEETEIVYVATSKSHTSCACDLQGREELRKKGYFPRTPSCQTKTIRNQCSCKASPTLETFLRRHLGDISSNTGCKLTNDCVCTVSAAFKPILSRKGIDFVDYSSRFRKSPTEANKWLENQGIKVMIPQIEKASPNRGSNSPNERRRPYSPRRTPLRTVSTRSLPSLPTHADDPAESLRLLEAPIPGSTRQVRCRAECMKKHGNFIVPGLKFPNAIATSRKYTSCKCELSKDFVEEVETRGQESLLEEAACVTKSGRFSKAFPHRDPLIRPLSLNFVINTFVEFVRKNECLCKPTYSLESFYTTGEYNNEACKLISNYCDCEISTTFGNYLKKQGLKPRDYASRFLQSPKSANEWLATQGIQVRPYEKWVDVPLV